MKDEGVSVGSCSGALTLVSSLSLQPSSFLSHPTSTDFHLLSAALAAIMLTNSNQEKFP